jgi:hypothetical protein
MDIQNRLRAEELRRQQTIPQIDQQMRTSLIKRDKLTEAKTFEEKVAAARQIKEAYNAGLKKSEMKERQER